MIDAIFYNLNKFCVRKKPWNQVKHSDNVSKCNGQKVVGPRSSYLRNVQQISSQALFTQFIDFHIDFELQTSIDQVNNGCQPISRI